MKPRKGIAMRNYTLGTCPRCDREMVVEIEGRPVDGIPEPCNQCRDVLHKGGVVVIWNEAQEGVSK